MRVLITGGAGFIGSHLAEVLLDRGDRVDVIDDLSTGSMTNIDGMKTNPRFTYTLDTIMNCPVMAELVDRCDMIYHLAAAVGVRLIVESPVRTISTNIRGTEICLDMAAKKGKKVVIASTSEVYGKSTRIPFREDDDIVFGPTVKSRWSYACSKAIDEFLALAYFREGKLPAVVSSTSWARARPGATGWCCRASSGRRSGESRSPFTAPGRRRGASCTWAT